MTLNGTRFGSIDYTEEDVIHFPDGMIGFPSHRQFLVLNHRDDSPFQWLQSIDQPELSMLVTSPERYVPSYSPILSGEQAERLNLTQPQDACVLTTVAIPHGKPEEMALNLAGPIVINTTSKLACQVVLDDEAYT